ncbi:MAG TPA: gamma-glutamylcyclotransferase family protein [Candidatus Angelobacter sp.]
MPERNPTRLLFAYGTLKRRGRLHRQLVSQGARYRGRARIRGRLFQISGTSYPGAVPTRSDDFVAGELYELEIPAEALKKIDKLEGCDEGLFVRKLVGAWVDDDRKVRAWAYFYAKPLRKSRAMPSGRFSLKRPTRAAPSRGAA